MRQEYVGLLALAVCLGHAEGHAFYARGWDGPPVVNAGGVRLYHHSASVSLRGGWHPPKFKRSKRSGPNQRKLRKDRRRAFAAGDAGAFCRRRR